MKIKKAIIKTVTILALIYLLTKYEISVFTT